MAQSKIGPLLNADIGAAEDIAVLDVSGFAVLWLEFTIAAAALTAFTIEYRLSGSGTWLPMASAGADFTTPVHPVIRASGALPTAGLGNHWAKLDILGIHSVRIRAAGTASSLTGKYSLG